MSQSHPKSSLGYANRRIPDEPILYEDAHGDRSPNNFSRREQRREWTSEETRNTVCST